MSAVTFSGFNNIDFTLILNSMMAQERLPLETLKIQQSSLRTQSTAFATLATKLGSLGSAASALVSKTAFGGRSVATTDSNVVAASGSSSAVPGIYDVVVRELARAQVTVSSSTFADKDTTNVATGGTITIGGVAVALSGAVTLQGLADAINAKAGIGVTASIVSPAAGSFQLVLTGKDTGTANAFTITNALTGTTVAFTDTDSDGISGDSAADNAMSAVDADVLINNVAVISSTNTIEDAIPGVTLNLLKKQPASAVTVSVTESTQGTASLVDTFVSAYNGLLTFAQQQNSSSSGIGRDPLFRSLRGELRTVLTAEYEAGGALGSLGAAGIEFDRTGRLSVNTTLLNEALASNATALRQLFMGDGVNPGVFDTLRGTVDRYTNAGALLSSTQDRLNEQIRSMDNRLATMETRLETRRAALQKEFIAADMLITQLNSQVGSLQSLGNQYSLF